MSGANIDLVKTFIAEGAIAEYCITAFGAGDKLAKQASSNTDKLNGVVGLPRGCVAEGGQSVDVILGDIANVLYGGVVARGDLLTADAQGRAIVATAGSRTVGMAQSSGVLGDIGSVLIQFGQI